MKFSCTQENVQRGLSIVSHITSKNTSLPILQNILFKSEAGNITLTSTNLEMAIRCSIRGKADENGECTIPAKLLSDYVSLLPNEPMNMTWEGNQLAIACGNHKTKINGMPSSEFPLVPKSQSEQVFQIPTEKFRAALSQTLFSVATHETRPELTGALLRFEKGENDSLLLTIASTDSYRLSERSIPLPTQNANPVDVIVPAKTLAEVARILSLFKDDISSPANLELHCSNGQATVIFGSVELTSKILEGTYPDYRQIIPKQYKTDLVLDREDLIKAIKTASLFSKNGLFDVQIEVQPEQKQILIKSTDTNRGENETICQAEGTGVQNIVTVNYRYVLDGLQAMKSEQVSLRMIDGNNPCLLIPKDAEERYTYLVMPIRQ